jgi:sulfate transport system substrate-binding protein
MKRGFSTVAILALVAIPGCAGSDGAVGGDTQPEQSVEILNVSYDPTRELWKQLNEKFVPNWKQRTGQDLKVNMSHGGSGGQARAVIDGLEADVVTLALWNDTNAIRKAGLIEEGWEEKLPNGSLPYSSTVVFVVRKGNPKGIHDWPDLVKPGVSIVTPNPKTSGGGKLNLLSAWGSVVLRGGSEQDAREFLTKLFSQVAVLDTGARGATTTFAQKGIGDVQLTWENEGRLEIAEAKGELELVFPKISIRAEPRVAVVDENVDRKNTREVAQAYLEYLYTEEAQDIIAKNYYRPYLPEVLERHADLFPPMELFSIKKIANGWEDAEQKFFADGGIFDSVYQDPGKQ